MKAQASRSRRRGRAPCFWRSDSQCVSSGRTFTCGAIRSMSCLGSIDSSCLDRASFQKHSVKCSTGAEPLTARIALRAAFNNDRQYALSIGAANGQHCAIFQEELIAAGGFTANGSDGIAFDDRRAVNADVARGIETLINSGQRLAMQII